MIYLQLKPVGKSLSVFLFHSGIIFQVPPNGLVIYTGTVVTEDGKEKKLNIDFEPFKPINTSLYLCDNKFHTEALNELLESDQRSVQLPGPLQTSLAIFHSRTKPLELIYVFICTCAFR